MISTLTCYRSLTAVLLFLFASQCLAQDLSDQSRGGTDAAGIFAPFGPPLELPIRVDAGGSCIVDLKQAYEISGTLAGSLKIEYRIIVYGPCEVSPVIGKYDEEWIAHGDFIGTVDGSAGTASFSYVAKVKAGGSVTGRITLGDGIEGELAVSGNFNTGRLSYSGRVK